MTLPCLKIWTSRSVVPFALFNKPLQFPTLIYSLPVSFVILSSEGYLHYTTTHAQSIKQIFLFWPSKALTKLRFFLVSEFQGAFAWMTWHHIARFDACELVKDSCLSFSAILSFLRQTTSANNVWDQGTQQSSIWRSNEYPCLWGNWRIAVSESSFPLSVTEHGTTYLRGASKQSLWSLRK